MYFECHVGKISKKTAPIQFENLRATYIPTSNPINEATSTKKPFLNPLYTAKPNIMAKTISIITIVKKIDE